jgi:hypothetical protein
MRSVILLVLVLVLVLVLPACGARAVAPDAESDASGSSTGGGTSSTSAESTTTESTDGSQSETSTESGGGGFVPDGGGGQCGELCELLEPDCPEGEKCAAVQCMTVPELFSETICYPIEGDAQPGESCTFTQDSLPTHGLDTCAPGSLCWAADSPNPTGTCFAYCETDSQCAQGQSCTPINFSPDVSLCLQLCDPLLADCEAGQMCVREIGRDLFHCVPTNNNSKVFPEACESVLGCAPDHTCMKWATGHPPECGADSCCLPYCEVGDSSTCAAGLECHPLFDPEAMNNEHVGVCRVPA